MRYHDITKDDMNNGDGLRTVLWLSGCSHCCEDCQNPVTWDPEGGIEFDEAAKEELYDNLSKSYISGVTLSGGDPLYPRNVVDVTNLAREIKEKFPNKTIWLYTGSVWDDIKGYAIMEYVDVVVDGEFVKALKDNTLCWKGSKNQRVIDVKKSLDSAELILHCDDYYKGEIKSIIENGEIDRKDCACCS